MPEEQNPGQGVTSEDAHATTSIAEDNPSASGRRPIDVWSRVGWNAMTAHERRGWLRFAAASEDLMLVPADPARMSGDQAKALVAALVAIAKTPGSIWDLSEEVRQTLLESLWGAPRALPGSAGSRCRRVWNVVERNLTADEKRRLGERLVADAEHVGAAQAREAANA